MIKFFRKIRQSLLFEEKTGKYLKYAIGEIILVMVGILIALQVNTWNENRLAQARIDSRLMNLVQDVDADIEEMQGIMERAGKRVTVMKAILQGCGRTGSFIERDSIFPAFKSEDFKYPNANISFLMTMDGHSSTYEGLVSSGEFYLIEDQELAKDIQTYYAEVDEHQDAERWNNQETWLILNQSKHRLGLGTYSREGTLEKLIELARDDKQFGAVLEHAYILDIDQHDQTANMISQARELAESIKSYCEIDSDK
jgi:hypothetical protein